MRDHERPISKDDDVYRIGVFGDSITFGQGVELEDTFPKILEQQLNQVSSGPVEVFNFGVPGYNTVAEYEYLKEVHPRFEFDLVILQYTASNDTRLPLGESGSSAAWLRWTKGRLRNLHSYHTIVQRIRRLQFLIRPRDTGTGEGPASYEATLYSDGFEGWVAAQQALEDIVNFSRDAHLPVVFAIYANSTSLSPTLKSDLMNPIIRKVTTALERSGAVRVVLLDEAFRGYSGNESKLWVRPDDAHFSTLAHQLVAETLFLPIRSDMMTPDDIQVAVTHGRQE